MEVYGGDEKHQMFVGPLHKIFKRSPDPCKGSGMTGGTMGGDIGAGGGEELRSKRNNSKSKSKKSKQ